MSKSIALMVAATLAVAALPAWADEDKVAYPEEYRSWHHVKSMVIQAGHPLADPFEGIHHIYANEKAVEGYRSGQFEEGAVIVFDLLQAEAGDDAIQEGKRKLIGVMERDPDRFESTGGWGFEGFAGDGRERLTRDGGQSCFACHASEKQNQYVFSRLRE